MKYTAILIDDEYTSSEVLKYEIENLNLDIDIIGIYEDPVEGLKALKNESPNLLFLDIEMPRLNGFEVLDLLGQGHNINVIFVTAYNQHAVTAFEYYAVDYLVKPVSPERLAIAVQKAIQNNRVLEESDIQEMSHIINEEINFSDKIVVPIQNGYQMIETSDIIRCEADSNYTSVYLNTKEEILVSKSLKHFETLLKEGPFLRIHQTHLINLNFANQLIKSDGGYIKMKDGKQVPIARSQKQSVIDFFKRKSV